MPVVTLNQYKGTFNGGLQETVVAESMIKAATLLTDESAGTEPSFLQKTLEGIKVDQPRMLLQFETAVSPVEAETAGCTAAPPSFTVLEGTEVIFSAATVEGWAFVGWQKNGVDIAEATNPVSKIAVTDDDVLTNEVIVYTAVFEIDV